MKIDLHVHCNSLDKTGIRNLAATCEETGTIAVLSGGKRYGNSTFADDEKVMELAKSHPGVFLAAARFDLWEQVDPADVGRLADAGFKMLKFIYPYYEYDHDLYMPVYEAAEKAGLPVLFHTGNYRPSPADIVWKRPVLRNMMPLTIDRIARSFQNLKIVMAHLGTTIWRHETAEYLKIHANLYADLAGSGSWGTLSAEEMIKLMGATLPLLDTQYTGFRKLVLGSDAYVTKPGIVKEAQDHYLAMFQKIGLPDDVVNGIMGETAARWLGLK